jgi:hypothetical protein
MEEMKNSFEMTPDEKIDAVQRLRRNLEDNFVELGQLLSEIKRSKMFKFRGYKSFKDFVEEEFQMAGSFASKVVGIYDLYINELDVDEHTVKQIGLDKLHLVKPMVKDKPYQESMDWVQRAQTEGTGELREEIKEIRKREKEKDKDLKAVYIDQYLERMVSFFNCSRKELNFKLALYFQDRDLQEVQKEIKVLQRRFEEQSSGDEPAEVVDVEAVEE